MNHQIRGFGLVELMVSIVIGLIALAGITSLVVATMRANTDNLGMTRLTQDMRAVMQLVTRDLRRAAYDQNAIRDFGSGNQTSNDFSQLRVFDSGGNEIDLTDTGIAETNPAPCVLFSYDSDGDGDAQPGEFRGFKLDANSNTIKAKISGSAADANCDDGTGAWEELTDAAAVRIDEFGISTMNGAPIPVFSDTAGNPILTVRRLVISMDAGLVNDESVQRSMRETIRVRNDLLD